MVLENFAIFDDEIANTSPHNFLLIPREVDWVDARYGSLYGKSCLSVLIPGIYQASLPAGVMNC